MTGSDLPSLEKRPPSIATDAGSRQGCGYSLADFLASLRGWEPSWRTKLWFTLIPAILLVLRSPGDLLAPQFYAEDGPVFYAAARDLGFAKSLLTPTEGYLNTFPRLSSALVQILPVEAGPLAFKLIGLLLRLVPVAYLLSRRAAAVQPGFLARLFVSVLYLLLPNAGEVGAGLTNAQWILAPLAILIISCAPPAGASGWIADMVLLGLCALTGPTSIVLAPVALLSLRRSLFGSGRVWIRAVAGILIAGAVTQALTFAAQPPTHRLHLSNLREVGVGNLARIVSTHVVYNNLFGWRAFTSWHDSFGMPLYLAGLLLILVLAVFISRLRHTPLLALLYVATATIALAFLFPSNDLKLWLNPSYSQRYYYYASLFFVLATARLAFSKGWGRWLGFPLLTATLLIAVPGAYRFAEQFDTRFRDQMTVFGSLPPGAELVVPIYPGGWGMKLRKKPSDRITTNTLANLPQLPQAPSVSLEELRIVRLNGAGGELFFEVSGFATEQGTGRKGGGVLIMAGERVYPAIYGMQSTFPAGGPPGPYETAFVGYVPVSALRPGKSGLHVAVMSADRKSVFRPYGPMMQI